MKGWIPIWPSSCTCALRLDAHTFGTIWQSAGGGPETPVQLGVSGFRITGNTHQIFAQEKSVRILSLRWYSALYF